jgi:hypothetical protein
MKYTFSRRCGAFTATGRALVYVPDQVVADQQRFRNQSFTVMRRDGSKTRARLRSGGHVEARAGGAPVVALN